MSKRQHRIARVCVAALGLIAVAVADANGRSSTPPAALAPGAPAVGRLQAAGGLHGRVLQTVALKSAWKVRKRTQLILTDGAMTCRVASLVQRPGRAATGARVSCTGPGGSPGLTYRLKLVVPGVRGATRTVKIRFPIASFTSVAALTASAPGPSLPGTMATRNQVSFLVPDGWVETDYANAVQLSAPAPGGCDVFVFDPVVPDLGNAGQNLYPQLYGVVSSLYPGQTVPGEDGNANAYRTVRGGATAYGFPYAALVLAVPAASGGTGGLSPIEASITVYTASLAVPVVKIGLGCTAGFTRAGQAAAIEMLMTADGSTPNPRAYQKAILGSWSSGGGNVLGLYAYAANGHYLAAFSSNWQSQIGGSLYDVYLNFAGNGNYAVLGPVLAFLPTGTKAWSELISIYTEGRWDDATGAYKESTKLCEVLDGSGPGPGEGCSTKGS
jgi:hypothetical protein